MEVHFHRYRHFETDALHRTAFEAATQEFHVCFVQELALESVAGAFFLHYVDVERFYQQTHFVACLEAVVILHHQLVALAGLYQHFVVHAFEDGACYGSRELRRIRGFEDVDVLRTDYDVHLCTVAETGIHAVELVFAEAGEPVVHHDTVQYVALADEVGYEGVDRLVVDVCRSADLLYPAFAHHDDGVAQGEGLFLVVGDVYEGDAQLLVHLFEFHLHVLAHLQVEGGKGLVEEQHFGFVDDGTGYGNALLLSAGEGVHVAVFIVGHAHHAERLLHFLFDSGGGELLQLEAESNVVEYVEVGKQGVLLEHRIHRAAVGRCLRDVFSCNGNHSFRSCLEACNQTQQCRLSATGRSQYRYKLALADRQIHIIQYGFVSEELRYVLYTDDAIGLLHKHFLLYPNLLNKTLPGMRADVKIGAKVHTFCENFTGNGL